MLRSCCKDYDHRHIETYIQYLADKIEDMRAELVEVKSELDVQTAWAKAYSARNNEALDKLYAARAELKELHEKTYCAYCGHAFVIADPAAQALVEAHIRTCEKHPMREMENEKERMRDVLEKIASWADAYPVDIFPEPNFVRVNELLVAGGESLSCVSASNMRHVITGVGDLARAALKWEAKS